MSDNKKAVLLLSGGLDSATTGAIAKADGYDLYAMSFSYGQRHSIELQAAEKVAKMLDVKEHRVAEIDLRVFGGSALTDDIDVPKSRSLKEIGKGIPVTYVPARNTIFLSYALAWAELLGAYEIFIGVNALDYSGYPDCRLEFIRAYEDMANLATAYAVQNDQEIKIRTPLVHLTKAQIISEGLKRGVDYSVTLSCYDPTPDGKACGQCDSCLLRQKGFSENGMEDPAEYVSKAA